jgi:hypothetical protein
MGNRRGYLLCKSAYLDDTSSFGMECCLVRACQVLEHDEWNDKKCAKYLRTNHNQPNEL